MIVRYVSLEFLYGTWEFFWARAIMTFPRLDRDLLMLLVSVSLIPSLPLSFTFSLPARSTLNYDITKFNEPEQVSEVAVLCP